MFAWEYAVFPMIGATYWVRVMSDCTGCKECEATEAAPTRHLKPVFRSLDDLGAQGWEMVAAIFQHNAQGEMVVGYFKRPLGAIGRKETSKIARLSG